MFRIVCDPSSGSTELCLTEITLSGSQIFFVYLVSVWQCNFEPAVCVHGTCTHTAHSKLRCHTDQAHEKYLWTTKSNFSQAQLSTPWWRIAHVPKHVGV